MPAAPAPAVTVYGDGQCIFWGLYSVAFSSSEVALISAFLIFSFKSHCGGGKLGKCGSIQGEGD